MPARKVNRMAKIQFKRKIEQAWNPDDSPAYRIVRVPELTRSHCERGAFRLHPRYGGIANPALFPNALARIRRDVLQGKDCLRLDMLPDSVTIDESGFLAVVT